MEKTGNAKPRKFGHMPVKMVATSLKPKASRRVKCISSYFKDGRKFRSAVIDIRSNKPSNTKTFEVSGYGSAEVDENAHNLDLCIQVSDLAKSPEVDADHSYSYAHVKGVVEKAFEQRDHETDEASEISNSGYSKTISSDCVKAAGETVKRPYLAWDDKLPDKAYISDWVELHSTFKNNEYSVDSRETLKMLNISEPFVTNDIHKNLVFTEGLPGISEACVWEYSRRQPLRPSLTFLKLEGKTVLPFQTNGSDKIMIMVVVSGRLTVKSTHFKRNSAGRNVLVGVKASHRMTILIPPGTPFSLENWSDEAAVLRKIIFHQP